MKTITEMQKHMKEISEQLDLLAQDFLEYNKKKDTINYDRMKQIEVIGCRYPISGHMLEKSNDFVKKQYITLLIMAINTAHEKTDGAWLLTQRIAAGSKFDCELSELMVDAATITKDQLYEFTNAIITNHLIQPFALDVMLIYLECGHDDNVMLEFVVALLELIKCPQNELRELVTLAKIIVEQDSNSYLNFCFENVLIDLTNFYGYIKLFHQGILSCNETLFSVWFDKKGSLSNHDLNRIPDQIRSKKVTIDNAIFKGISENDKWFSLIDNESISVQNCDLLDNEKPIKITNAKKIVIDNCLFKNMSYRAVYVREAQDFVVQNSIFQSCKFDSHDEGNAWHKEKAYGGALYLYNIKTVKVYGCSFEHCSTAHYEKGAAGGAVACLYDIDESEWMNDYFNACQSSRWSYGWSDTGYIFHMDNCPNVKTSECTYRDSPIPYSMRDNGFKLI